MALSEHDRNQLIQTLEAARSKEADNHADEARPLYEEALRLDPENREAAFFLYVYDAAGLSRGEFGDACKETAERLTAAAGELAQAPDAAARFAPMAKRSLNLANRYLKALDRQEEHFSSTVRQDIQLNQQRNNRARKACYDLLACVEKTADGIPGAEQAAQDARKASLNLLNEHGEILDPRVLRTETKRLQDSVGVIEPQDAGPTTRLRRFGQYKFKIAAVLLVLCLAASIVYYHANKSLTLRQAEAILAAVDINGTGTKAAGESVEAGNASVEAVIESNEAANESVESVEAVKESIGSVEAAGVIAKAVSESAEAVSGSVKVVDESVEAKELSPENKEILEYYHYDVASLTSEQVDSVRAYVKNGISTPELIYNTVLYAVLYILLYLCVRMEYKKNHRHTMLMAGVFLGIHAIAFILKFLGGSGLQYLSAEIGSISCLLVGIGLLMLVRSGPARGETFSWMIVGHALLVTVLTVVSYLNLHAWQKPTYLLMGVWSVLFDLAAAILLFDFNRKHTREKGEKAQTKKVH